MNNWNKKHIFNVFQMENSTISLGIIYNSQHYRLAVSWKWNIPNENIKENHI